MRSGEPRRFSNSESFAKHEKRQPGLLAAASQLVAAGGRQRKRARLACWFTRLARVLRGSADGLSSSEVVGAHPRLARCLRFGDPCSARRRTPHAGRGRSPDLRAMLRPFFIPECR